MLIEKGPGYGGYGGFGIGGPSSATSFGGTFIKHLMAIQRRLINYWIRLILSCPPKFDVIKYKFLLLQALDLEDPVA